MVNVVILPFMRLFSVENGHGFPLFGRDVDNKDDIRTAQEKLFPSKTVYAQDKAKHVLCDGDNYEVGH